MRHLRSDYDAVQPWPVQRPHIETNFEEDEPVFILRPRDSVAADTVRHWAELAQEAGAEEHLVDAAMEWADEMETWAATHGGAKVPDTPKERLVV